MRRFEPWLVLALCLLIGWFYTWTVRSSGDEWKFDGEKRDYFNLLIDGYLDGQLNMKADVPAALLQLRNPYDPQERPAGLGLHDASFYNGKYYVYFGVAPMMVLMLPFRLLTGMDLPLPVAILVFVYAGFLASVMLWLAVRRRYFPETSTLIVLPGVLVPGLAGVSAVLLRRPDMWELPIAGGYCFAMLALAAIWRSLHAGKARGRWFATAGLWLGLAIASRPTYLITAPLLLPPLLWWWRSERRLPWRTAVSAVVPLAIIGTLMAGHNYARFEDPLEFGQAYQFSLDYESKLPHFRAAYVPFTAKAYFFAKAEWSWYFPFIQRPDPGPAPAGFTIHRGDVHGILFNYPVAWLACLSPLALWRRQGGERGLLGAWLASVALLFLCAAGLMLFFFSALARYQMDFLPALMLLACVGLLGITRWVESVNFIPWRVLVRAGPVIAAVASAGFGLLFSLQYEGLLGEHDPALEKRVARRLNGVSALVERIAGVKHGPLEIAFRLPARSAPGRETLFTVADPPVVDRFMVRYLEDGRLQFGVVPHGSPEQLSRPLSLARTAPHRLRVSIGSLYPPSSHPFHAGKSAEEIRRITRELRIELNDEPVLIGHQRTSMVDSSVIAVGANVAAEAAHPWFRGTIESVRRLGRGGSITREALGPFVRLRVAFNAAAGAGCEPLIAFGESGSAGLLAVMHAGTSQVKFGFLREGEGMKESRDFEIAPGRVHELKVQFESGGKPDHKRMLIGCDSQLAWAPEITWRGELPSITIGKNPLAGTECAPEFRGTVYAEQHDVQGGDPLAEPGGMRLRVRLPADGAGQCDPLVVTGRSGAGDMLVIQYVDGRTVRFGHDHWGSPMVWSEPVPVDFAQPLTLEIALPSLRTVEDAALMRGIIRGRLSLSVNGRPAWQQTREFYPAEPEEVAVGRNPIGGTTSGREFRGEVLSAERVGRE